MTTYNQIFYVQGCSAVFSAFSLFSSGQMMPAISFIQSFPEAGFHVFLLSMSSTTANLFISYTIKEFGALIFATIMTTRQFISILMSCVLFLHPLSWPGQYAGITVVFAALYYKSLTTKSHKDKAPRRRPDPQLHLGRVHARRRGCGPRRQRRGLG